MGELTIVTVGVCNGLNAAARAAAVSMDSISESIRVAAQNIGEIKDIENEAELYEEVPQPDNSKIFRSFINKKCRR